MLLRNGTCRALGVSGHEATQCMRAIAHGAFRQRDKSPLSQTSPTLRISIGPSLRKCPDAAGLRIGRLVLDEPFERSCKCATG